MGQGQVRRLGERELFAVKLCIPIFTTQRRSDGVDLCEINYLGSSLIDFCILTGKRFWLSLRRTPLFKSRFKAGSSRGKR